MKILGLDIGSNSVGSAWIDTDSATVCVGDSVFPAGVEERSDGRGEPKNLARRSKRSQRVSLRRRSDRRLELRRRLQEWEWMPTDPDALKAWMGRNPWHLRRDGLAKALSGKEFGRILLHMSQRRGPSWCEDEEDSSQQEQKGKAHNGAGPGGSQKSPLKAANEATEKMLLANNMTFGQLMADLFDQRHTKGKPIRNRTDREGNPTYEFFPLRQMLRDEFEKLWAAQSSFDSELAKQLSEDRKRELYDPSGNNIWKCRGLLWGQRNTYWDAGRLGRCDLEPTDRACPKADLYAQEFLVLQDVNNIRVIWEGEPPRPLDPQERQKVLLALEIPKTATAKTVRAALGLNRKDVRDLVTLNHSCPKQFVNPR